jgi:ABC-type bacteriocin/lantibiotic exporter with double-glycine peptidase domain
MKNILNLIDLLNYNERLSAIKLTFLMLTMAIIEMLGIASILPFITILTNPDIVQSNFILRDIFETTKSYGVENINQFNIVVGVFVFFILVFSIFFKAFTNYKQFFFVDMYDYSISKRLVNSYLSQPYSWFLDHHSSDLGRTILSEVQEVVNGYLKPIMDLVAKFFVVIAISIMLILTDPILAIVVFSSFGLSYLFIYYLLKKKIKKLGAVRFEANKSRFEILTNIFTTIKEIKIGRYEKNFLELYKGSAYSFARAKVYSQIFSQLPKFFLEIIIFGGVILLILYFILQKGSLNNSLPILSLFVFAGYRMLPAFQSIYISFTKIVFFKTALEKVLHDIRGSQNYYYTKEEENFLLEDKISLKNISYQYSKISRQILKNINIIIPAKSITGIVGATGSGKTTIIDIILGLLEPQKGNLEVDSKIITKNNLESWQKQIGYVPQNINLIDDSIISNIAFGEDSNEDINITRVIKVSKIAKLHNFIFNNLPDQYQTKVGERGIRLSGGQRQRIGIARALYHNPKVLVLDEATSALDDETEKEIMDSIKSLSKNLTIIMIAHRKNTIKYCDLIYKINNGQVEAHGTFKELFRIL